MSEEAGPPRSNGSKMLRFAVVGLANTVIDLAAFAVLLPHVAWPVVANVLAWIVAAMFSFVANSLWSFERDRSLGVARSFLRFASLGALISLGVSSLSILALSYPLGVWPAKIIGVIAAAVLNFLAARWSIEGRLWK